MNLNRGSSELTVVHEELSQVKHIDRGNTDYIDSDKGINFEPIAI